MNKLRIVTVIILCLIASILGGCKEMDDQQMTINRCINSTNMNYDEIIDLVCDPGYDSVFNGEDYDLLGKLSNLESITIVGIGDSEAAQLFFTELANLETLSSVVLIDSRIGKISKLAEIKNLINLSIELRQGSWFQIDDYNVFTEKENFQNLKSLKLDDPQLEYFPNLSGLTNLESLTFSSLKVTELNYEHLNWTNLISMDIRYTGITLIDDRIVDQLNNLQYLDISNTNISDLNFVLKLPNLVDFKVSHNEDFSDNQNILRDHPNFNESWLD